MLPGEKLKDITPRMRHKTLVCFWGIPKGCFVAQKIIRCLLEACNYIL